MDIDALFSNMASAPVFGKGAYFEAGIFKVKVKTFKVNDGFNGKAFISEFDVLESNNPNIAVGSTRSFVLLWTNKYLMADISVLVMALLGEDPSKGNNANDPALRALVAQFTRAALGSEAAKKELGSDYQDGMFIGKEIRLECTLKPPGKSGKPFTSHKWSPLEG